MKKLHFILLLLTVTLSGMAQNVGETLYIYRNDGEFNAFFREEVQSIEYSYEDANGNTYDEIVTQIITTADSVYRIPLAAIDSLSFVQPETKYVSTVVHIQPLLPYIVSVEGQIINFASNIPSNLMPKVGDILLQDSFDSDKLPDGFAGRVVQISGQEVTCESVSFEDIYERLVCYGSYTAINDSESNSILLAPRRIRGKVAGGLSTAIGISGTVGSTETGIYGTVDGQLGMDLRVTINFSAGKPAYFDLSLAPNLNLSLTAGVKGQFSNNVLSKKVNLISLPIPDTPFLLKLKAGPVLKYSVDASVTITTETTLGYKFGVKYQDGSFKGYGQNTSKWFSAPDVTGHISGSVFAGLQTEFGISSYGDLLSLSLDKEAGAEFEANLTSNLLNSNNYENLRNAQFDLNLKASVGVSAEAKFFKWVIASANWTLLSGEMNINSWKLVPAFQKPVVNVTNPSSATISLIPSEKLLFPVSIGLGVWDSNNVLKDAQYCPTSYRVFENWGLSQYQTTFAGLTPNTNYVVNPLVKLFGVEIKASPGETFQTQTVVTTCPDENHPHMIDLGLPSGTKWACCNLGASSPQGYGDYYAWGETQPKSEYGWDTYQYFDSNLVYPDSWINIGYNIAGTQYDAATANWGAPWCMPSLTQIQELLNECTSTWTTLNGVNGTKFTGPNGVTIFLPAAGVRENSELLFLGNWGSYWSSALGLTVVYAYYLNIGSDAVSAHLYGSGQRFDGLPVRPVR